MILPPWPTTTQRTAWYKWLDKNAIGDFVLIKNGKRFTIQLSESYCNSYFYIIFLLKNEVWSKPKIVKKINLKFNFEKKEVLYNDKTNIINK